jgi:hypothetical protein
LPLVIGGEGAQPLIVVEGFRQGGFVAGGAVLGRFVEGAHDGLLVPVEVREDFGVGWKASNGLACDIDHDGGLSHNVTAYAAGAGDRADGVADHAGDPVFVVGSRDGAARGESPGQQGCRVMAAFAMAGVGDAFGVGELLHVLDVPRGAEAIGVAGLTPLRVDAGMAVTAVGGGGDVGGLEEAGKLCGCLAREVGAVAEGQIVGGSAESILDGVVGAWGNGGGLGVRSAGLRPRE